MKGVPKGTTSADVIVWVEGSTFAQQINVRVHCPCIFDILRKPNRRKLATGSFEVTTFGCECRPQT